MWSHCAMLCSLFRRWAGGKYVTANFSPNCVSTGFDDDIFRYPELFQFLVLVIYFYDLAENIGCIVLSGWAIRKDWREVVFARVADSSVYWLNGFPRFAACSLVVVYFVYVVVFLVVGFVVCCLWCASWRIVTELVGDWVMSRNSHRQYMYIAPLYALHNQLKKKLNDFSLSTVLK